MSSYNFDKLFKAAVGVYGIVLWGFGILEALFPSARWLNCGYVSCSWDSTNFFYLGGPPAMVVIGILGGEFCLIVWVLWDLLKP